MVVAAGEDEPVVRLRETPVEGSKRLPLAMKNASELRRNVGSRTGEFALLETFCGNNSDATSSREDSDSDCTCGADSSNQEDSGRFSADPVDSIIAPPSPFVTRNSLPKVLPLCPRPPPQSPVLAKGKTLQQEASNRAHSRVQEVKPLHSTTIYINGSAFPERGSTIAAPKENKDKKEANSQTATHTNLGTTESPNKPTLKQTTSVDSKSHSPTPKSHPGVTAPICKSCIKKEASFFNPSCGSCWAVFEREEATPSHVFAVLRLWVPEVQKCIAKLVRKALCLGCQVLDRDAVTDMTLLHYAVKAGANGIGDPIAALQVVSELLKLGADLRQRCRWTSMTALHYASYFDVPNILEFILKSSEGVAIDDPCLEYNNGTALHIAALNLSEGAFRVLLKHGASPWCKDSLGRTPQESLPSPDQFELVPDLQEMVTRMQLLVRREWKAGAANNEISGTAFGVSGRAILRAVGLKIGDRVLVSGLKTAILRYAGPTEFATGLWAGVELEYPQGRHDGTVKGVVYFRCAKNYGLFVPINRLTKIPNVSLGPPGGRERRRVKVETMKRERGERREPSVQQRRSLSLPPRRVNHGRVDVSRVASKVAQEIRNSERKIAVGDSVCVDVGMDVVGVVRFAGAVHFASGYWIGVELDEARGSHDGSVCGTRYFTCRKQHGIFAASSRVTKLVSNSESHSTPGTERRGRSSSITSKVTPNQMNGSLTDSFSSSSSSSSTPLLLGEEELIPVALPGVGHSQQLIKTAFFPTNTSMNNLNRCFSARYISSRQRQDEMQRQKEEKAREPQWLEPPTPSEEIAARRTKKENPHWLQIGHNVFYRNKVGIVRYIGRVHFAEGTWLGLELREKRGRHDGKVKGRRYFTCRNGHGVMVPPNKVTVHGLNGALLVRQEEDEENMDASYSDFSIL